MILDGRKIRSGEKLACDICIIGAGAAGITLALELASAGKEIILLEAGGMNHAGKAQELYQGTLANQHTHVPIDSDRYRQLGGTTALWGGRCIPFDAIDFEQRDYVPHSGWPITRQDMDEYYRRAHHYVECGDYCYSVSEAFPDGPAEMVSGLTDGDLIASTIERWSTPTNFGKAYRAQLKQSPNIKVYLHSIAVHLAVSEDGRRLDTVRVRTFGGTDFEIRAPVVVLSGGGREVTRLMLASNDVHAEGIGNHSDWLGRGYMCHFSGVIAQLKFKPDAEVVFGYEMDRSGAYCRRRLWISEPAQRRDELLNIHFLLDRPLMGDPSHGSGLMSLAFLTKRLARGSREQKPVRGKYGLYWRHLKNVLAGSPEIFTVLPKWSRKRFMQGRRIPSLLLQSKTNSYYVYYHTEQIPNRDSRLTLGEQRDAFGMRRLHIDYRIAEQEIDSVHRAHELLDRELRARGCGELVFLSEDPRADLAQHQAVIGHHIGTTRMAADPAQGVVDADCRVHGVENLYVASAATFPTSSEANPTLTVVAMACRLADHLVAGSQT